jgi:hypothetical protein
MGDLGAIPKDLCNCISNWVDYYYCERKKSRCSGSEGSIPSVDYLLIKITHQNYTRAEYK